MGRTGIAGLAPCEDFSPDFRYQRRKKLFVGGVADRFIRGKPAVRRDEWGVGRGRKFGVECHVSVSEEGNR